jgi:hypothetical protein
MDVVVESRSLIATLDGGLELSRASEKGQTWTNVGWRYNGTQEGSRLVCGRPENRERLKLVTGNL